MNKFGDNSKSYPAEMRTQLWPLCCGAKILSGFKNVGTETHEELVKQINLLCDEYVADHQVYAGEQMIPKLTFLTLNEGQMGSKKIMDAVEAAGFTLLFTAKPRGSKQGFFARDLSKSLVFAPSPKAAKVEKVAVAA